MAGKLGRTLLTIASKLSTKLAVKRKKHNKRKDNNKNKKKLIKQGKKRTDKGKGEKERKFRQ